MNARPVFRVLSAVIPAVCLILVTQYLWQGWTGLPPDAFTYLAAGERLNVGHSLYGPLGPGDRPVLDAASFAAPLLSPPLIAVVWRPLAAIGSWTVYVWWALTSTALIGTVVFLWLRTPILTGMLTMLALYPLAIELGVGNLNSIILAGSVVVWWLWREGRVGPAAWVAVVLTATKILPVFLLLWLLAVAPRQAWRPCLIAIATVLAVGIAGAGVGAHLDYVHVLGSTVAGSTKTAVLLVTTVAIVAFRRHPAVAYIAATGGMAVAWTLAVGLAVAAPVGLPARRYSRLATEPAGVADCASGQH